MGLDGTARRRWFGALVLLAALGMLIAGETFLKGHLRDFGFLIYWLLCFVLTGLAIIVAYLDAKALGQRTRRETRELLETTLKDIQTDATTKPRRVGRVEEQPPSTSGNRKDFQLEPRARSGDGRGSSPSDG